LYDDGQSDPSAVTRDYTLILDVAYPQSPLLSVFGGKITTYRRLAESVLDKLRPSFAHMTGSWTGAKPLPGGDIPNGDFEAYVLGLATKYPNLPAGYLRALARRQGTCAAQILGDATAMADLGTHFGHTLYAREVDYMVASEWAITVDDILWRRTKCGLHLNQAERDAVAAYLPAR
jgi:glycerol-3-phosphate dehydrogenase